MRNMKQNHYYVLAHIDIHVISIPGSLNTLDQSQIQWEEILTRSLSSPKRSHLVYCICNWMKLRQLLHVLRRIMF